ncbi:MAG: alpha/beta fold hydrolase [Pseudomonadales bacterium]
MLSTTNAATKQQKKQLASKADGQGIPFVWGHTLMGSMAQEDATGVFGWQDLTDIARVIRFDTLSHGQSSSSSVPDHHHWKRLAEDMWAIAQKYSRDSRVVLGGASMGSAIALHAALQQPERVKGLVLVIPPTGWEERRLQVARYELISKYLSILGNMPFRLFQFLARWEFRRNIGFREKLERNTARFVNTNNYRGVVAALRGAASSDLPTARELKGLNVPTLILAWRDDDVHPLSTAEKLEYFLPNATLSIAENGNTPYQWPLRVREFLLDLN